jgi:uncharacterized oxidoreductase
MRVPEYVAFVRAGAVDPAREVEVRERAPGVLEIDAGYAFGPVAGAAAAQAAVDALASAGTVTVFVRHSGHVGRVGAYVEQVARAGHVALALCSSPRAAEGWQMVAPAGGREGRLATNPIAYGFPVEGEPPIVADFSTSAMPEGVVRWLRQTGKPVPEGVLRDAEGRPTTDADDLYGPPRGAVQPLGGELNAHKGYALGLLVELLAVVLAGDDSLALDRGGNNTVLVAWAADGAVAARARALVDWIRSSPPLDPARPVQVPGEREVAARAAAAGVAVDLATWERLGELADEHGLELPRLA